MSVPFSFSNATGIIPLNQLDANFNFLANAVPEFSLAAGTVTQANQSNITAIGTLSSLSVTGGITAGSLTATQISGAIQTASQPNITQIGALDSLSVTGNVTAGTVTAALLTGQLLTAAQPSITSVGTLNSLAVSGNISGGNISVTNVAGAIITAAQPNITSVGSLTSLSVTGSISVTGGINGTLSTAAQPNVTSVGTLSSLSVAGSITGTLATASQPNITSVGTLTSLSVSGSLVGTLSTAAQPNVTSVGTLTSLSVSGNVTGGNLSVTGISSLQGIVTAPTAGNGTSNTQVATTAFVANSLTNVLPSGVIVMWSGSVASIPAGWFLCDGTNSTPDLRDRFVVGAGGTYNPAATGGSANAIVVSHTHTASSVVTDPGHRHTYNAPAGFVDEGFSGSAVAGIVLSNTGNAVTGITVATTIASAGSSGINANLPPYYALAYIMKA
jgi:hypothetical protein